MSPYLFVIAIEAFTRLKLRVKEFKAFTFHPKCSGLQLTHLCFVDDLMVFIASDLSSIHLLKKGASGV